MVFNLNSTNGGFDINVNENVVEKAYNLNEIFIQFERAHDLGIPNG